MDNVKNVYAENNNIQCTMKKLYTYTVYNNIQCTKKKCIHTLYIIFNGQNLYSMRLTFLICPGEFSNLKMIKAMAPGNALLSESFNEWPAYIVGLLQFLRDI